MLLLCAARDRTQSAAARPGLPCGGDLSGHLNAGVSAPAGQPADARRTPPVARSLSRSRPRRWCRPVGRRGHGRGGGRGGGRGVGLARSRAWSSTEFINAHRRPKKHSSPGVPRNRHSCYTWIGVDTPRRSFIALLVWLGSQSAVTERWIKRQSELLEEGAEHGQTAEDQ